MSVVDLRPASSAGDDPPVVGPGPQERAWRAAEAAAAEAMGTVNPAVARLVAALVDLLAADGWQGAGIRSPEHWVTWKAGVSHGRAAGLVRIARRVPDLPAWAEYANRQSLKGRRTNGAMVTLVESVRQDRRRRLTIFDQEFTERRGRTRVVRRFSLTFRTLPVPEMAARIERAGFRMEAALGDYDGRPWDLRADVWILIARKT